VCFIFFDRRAVLVARTRLFLLQELIVSAEETKTREVSHHDDRDRTASRNKRGKLEVPRLSDEAQKWAELALSIGMPYKNVVVAFLETFPFYLENDEVGEDRIVEILEDRFKDMRRRTARKSYYNIKETQEQIKNLLGCIPVASPLFRLIELEKMRQNPASIDENLLKVFLIAGREQERLMPREQHSPFGGLPDLPVAKQNPTPTETETPSTPTQGDGFGGAMMNHANPGQETREDS